MLKILKRTGMGLLALLILALGTVYGLSEHHIRRTYAFTPTALALRSDPATLARGRHVATTRGCMDCHGADLAGRTFVDDPVIGRLFASNLTPGEGGLGAKLHDADWVRAIRHGIRHDGRSVLVMPAQEFNALSDEDLGALIAYLKSLPAVDNAPPKANMVGPLGRALFLAGQIPLLPAELIDHEAPRPASPQPGVTREYGAYLASSCVGCHGAGLSGGSIPGAPPEFKPARNLTPDRETGLGGWTEADLFRALRTGKRPDGAQLDDSMPWKLTAQMTDDEIRAIWLYLQSVPAKKYGSH